MFLAIVSAWKSINSSLKTVKQIHIHMIITYNYCRDFGDLVCIHNAHPRFLVLESESELFTGDTSKDNHSPGPVLGKLVPSPHKRSKLSN